MTKTCLGCVYHLNGNPPICNAFHTPQSGAIECPDWEAQTIGRANVQQSILDQRFYRPIRLQMNGNDFPVPQEVQFINCTNADGERIDSREIERVEQEQRDREEYYARSQEGLRGIRLTAHEIDLQRRQDGRYDERRRIENLERLEAHRAESIERYHQTIQSIQRKQRELELSISDAPNPPTIALSDLRSLTDRISTPRNLRDRYVIQFIGMPTYLRGVNDPLPPSAERVKDPEVTILTAIATPDGLKWQFQGTVVID